MVNPMRAEEEPLNPYSIPTTSNRRASNEENEKITAIMSTVNIDRKSLKLVLPYTIID